MDIFLTVQLCEVSPAADSIDCAIAKPNQAGNSVWKVPGGGEQAIRITTAGPALIQPPPDTMVMKATAYLNKARNPNLFELNGICTGRAHCFWCVTR